MRMSTGQRLVEAMVRVGKDMTALCWSCLAVLVVAGRSGPVKQIEFLQYPRYRNSGGCCIETLFFFFCCLLSFVYFRYTQQSHVSYYRTPHLCFCAHAHLCTYVCPTTHGVPSLLAGPSTTPVRMCLTYRTCIYV